MNKTFLIIDSYNLFFRAMYSGCLNENSSEMRKGLLLSTMFMMIREAGTKFTPDHLIFCEDGHKSWRKEIYTPYKANRLEADLKKSAKDLEREQELKDVFKNEFLPFIKEKTNVTSLGFEYAEADDLIARFIALHPNDKHIIVSTDNDYIQLISDNVIIYNAMEKRIISKKVILNSNNNKPLKFSVKDGKVSINRTDFDIEEGESLTPMDDWYEYALFMKEIRGDKSDNIFSAYPRVRETSTKTKIGIIDAFNDRKDRGYNWQSFMNETWEDPTGKKHIVKEEFEKNKKIIDLSMIPEELRVKIDNYIMSNLNIENKSHITIYLIQLFNKWDMKRLADEVGFVSKYFENPFPQD